MIVATTMARIVPSVIERSDPPIPLKRNRIIRRDNPNIGVMSGATTIPPITIDTLSKASPSDTIALASVIRRKKDFDGLA